MQAPKEQKSKEAKAMAAANASRGKKKVKYIFAGRGHKKRGALERARRLQGASAPWDRLPDQY